MGMFNAIIPDELLHPTGLFKERLSQSSLYVAMQQVTDAEAQQALKWYHEKGLQFRWGKDEETELTERQTLQQCKMYVAAMRIADEFGYELVIDHGTEAYLLADQIAAASVPVVIGPLLTSRSKVELRNRSLANPGRLAAAGVRIAITTDHPVVPIHFLIHQATLAVKEGLDSETALRSITVNPAEIMSLDDRVGSLRPGRDADIVIWSGDPFEFATQPEHVFIRGREMRAPTRQDLLEQRYKALPPDYKKP
jgi:imidazolonepropionase-like amidohydrolase